MIRAWREILSLPRENRILALAMFMNRCGTMAIPYLMLYLTKHRGYAWVDAANIYLVFGVSAAATVPFTGRLCDWAGPRPLIIGGLIGVAACLAVVPFATSYHALLGLMAVLALFAEAVRPAGMVYLSQVNRPEDLRLATTLHRFAINLGMSIGPLVGGAIVAYSYEVLFWTNALAGGVAALTFAILSQGCKKSDGRTPALIDAGSAQEERHGEGVSWRHYGMFATGVWLFASVFLSLEAMLPLRITYEFQKPEIYYGALISINTVMIVLFEIALNVRMKAISDLDQLKYGLGLLCLGVALCLLAGSYWGLIIPTVLWTLGEMILFPASTSAALSLSGIRERGIRMGVYTAAFSLAHAFAPKVSTVLHAWAGFELVAVYTVVAGGLSYRLMATALKR